MKQKIIHYSLILGLMLGMSFSLVYGILYAIRPDQKPYTLFVTLVVCALICFVWGSNKQSFMRCTAMLLVVGVLWSMYLYKAGSLVSVYRQLFFFITRHKALLGVSFLVSVATYFFTFKKFKWFIPVGAGTVLYSWYVIQGFPLPPLAVEFFILISLCYYFYDYYETMPSKSKSYLKSISIFISVVLGITYMSAYIVPIQFTFLHRLFDKETYESRAYRYSEYYPYTGRLGGDLVLEDEKILDVVAPNRTYLRAGSQSIYTGHAWANAASEPNPFFIGSHALQDTDEALIGSQLLSDEPFEELFQGSAYRITFQDIRTRSLFIPLKMNNLAVSRNSYSIYQENEDTLFLDQPYGSGFIYVVQCYTPKYKSKSFDEAMKKSKPGLYKEAKASGSNPFGAEIDTFIERADQMYSQYTQLPESVTDRVREMAVTITQDYKSPYEKARAIEAYLAGNYTYTLTPGEASRTGDFVDQFLFEGKEGYCTYFASAMAVLTRCIGLPSRYVEGYTMPAETDGNKDRYTVTSKQAHAWVEVYFEGMGWVMFEPTASYQSELRGYTHTEQDAYYRASPVQEIPTQVKREPLREAKEIRWVRHIVVIMISIGAILIGGICGIYARKRHQMKQMSPNATICYFYQKALKELAYKKHPINPGETESMYAKRIDNSIYLQPVTIEEATQIYLKAQYSLSDRREEEAVRLKQFYKQCRKNLKYREKRD